MQKPNKVMSVKFKVIPRGEPGVLGGGAVKYYASAKTTGTVNIDELTYSRVST